MRDSKLNVLQGLKVLDLETSSEEMGIVFEKGVVLVIYNEFELQGVLLKEARSLIGSKVISTYADSDCETIDFERGVSISVFMNDDAFRGPEAMQLRVPGEPIMVWT